MSAHDRQMSIKKQPLIPPLLLSLSTLPHHFSQGGLTIFHSPRLVTSSSSDHHELATRFDPAQTGRRANDPPAFQEPVEASGNVTEWGRLGQGWSVYGRWGGEAVADMSQEVIWSDNLAELVIAAGKVASVERMIYNAARDSLSRIDTQGRSPPRPLKRRRLSYSIPEAQTHLNRPSAAQDSGSETCSSSAPARESPPGHRSSSWSPGFADAHTSA